MDTLLHDRSSNLKDMTVNKRSLRDRECRMFQPTLQSLGRLYQGQTTVNIGDTPQTLKPEEEGMGGGNHSKEDTLTTGHDRTLN